MKYPFNLIVSAVCFICIAFFIIPTGCVAGESRDSQFIAYLSDFEPYVTKDNVLLGNTSNGVFCASSDYTNVVFNVSWDNFIFRTTNSTNVLAGAVSRDADDIDEQSLKDAIERKIEDALNNYMDFDLKDRLAELGRQYWDEHLEEELQNDAHWKEFLKDSLHLNLRSLNPVPDMSDLLTEELMAYWTSERLQQDSHWEGFVDQALDLNIKALNPVPDMSDFLTEELTKYWTSEQLQKSPLWNWFVDDALELNIKAFNPVPDISERLTEELMKYLDEHLEEELQNSEDWREFLEGELNRNISQYTSETTWDLQSQIGEWAAKQISAQMELLDKNETLCDFIASTINSEIQEYIDGAEFDLQEDIDSWVRPTMSANLDAELKTEKVANFINDTIRDEIQEYIDGADFDLQSDIDSWVRDTMNSNLDIGLKTEKVSNFINDTIATEIQEYIDGSEFDLQSDINDWMDGQIKLALEHTTVTINSITNETYENTYVTNQVFNEYFTTNFFETFITNNIINQNYITNNITEEVTTINYTTNYIYEGHVVDVDVGGCHCDTNRIDSLESRIAALEEDGDDGCSCDLTSISNQLADIQSQVDNIGIDSALAPLENKVSELEESLSSTKDTVSYLEDRLSDEVNDLRNRIDASACNCSPEDVSTKLDDLEHRIESLEDSGSGCDCDREALSNLVDRVEALEEGGGCDCDLTSITNSIEELRLNVDSLTFSFQGLDQYVDSMSTDVYHQLAEIYERLNALEGSSSSVPAPRSISNESIAPEFSTNSVYGLGAIVFSEGRLYECTNAVQRAGGFNGGSWKPTSIAAMLQEMREIDKRLTNQ